MLLKTYIRHGRITYQDQDILGTQPGWRPTARQESDLMKDCNSIPLAIVTFVSTNNGGVTYTVAEVKGKSSACCSACLLL